MKTLIRAHSDHLPHSPSTSDSRRTSPAGQRPGGRRDGVNDAKASGD